MCHYYILKWFNEELEDSKWSRKMCFALHRMKQQLTKSENIEELSKLYEEVRISFSKEISETNVGRKCSDSTKLKISNANKGRKFDKDIVKRFHHFPKGHIPWNKNGGLYSNEARLKMKQCATGNTRRRDKRPIYCFDLNWNLIKEYDSSFDAKNELKIHKIREVLNFKRDTSGGYHFAFKEDCLYFF